MLRRFPLAAAAAIGFLASCCLAGCTGPADTSATPTSSAAASPGEVTGSDYEIPEVSGTCVDGTATIVDDSSQITLDGDCETVVVEASNSIVTITGSVTDLTLNSSISLVNVATVANVTFVEGANGNKVVTPSTPAVTDGGEDNAVAAE